MKSERVEPLLEERVVISSTTGTESGEVFLDQLLGLII